MGKSACLVCLPAPAHLDPIAAAATSSTGDASKQSSPTPPQFIWRLVPDAADAAEVRVKRGRDEQAPVFAPSLHLKTFSYVAPANNGFIVEQALLNLFPNLRPDKQYDNVDVVWKPSLLRTPDQFAY